MLTIVNFYTYLQMFHMSFLLETAFIRSVVRKSSKADVCFGKHYVGVSVYFEISYYYSSHISISLLHGVLRWEVFGENRKYF